jgi:hypothetical protein
MLQDGPTPYSGLETTEAIARELAHHLFEHVRVSGVGRWSRLEVGTWKLIGFTVKSFEILSDVSWLVI